jgi:hypothetical protein
MTQVALNRYAFVVLPDMRIDRVNDVWGDAEPWSSSPGVASPNIILRVYPIMNPYIVQIYHRFIDS